MYVRLLAASAAILVGFAATAAAAQSRPPDARPSGVKADGVTDDTRALQRALDEAGKTGGVVRLPAGRYRVSGSIRVPPGVALEGVARAPLYIQPLIGTVIFATGGRDREDGPALFELGDSATVVGLTVFYPDQKPTAIHPYPWTFHLVGGDNTVENVTLINSYNGIQVGPETNVRHRIRSVYGCVLRRGIRVDNCTDIGRIDNVQFHCHWWSAELVGGKWDPVFEYMWRNCEAFIFGRSDWEYVTNTFVFPVNIGYRFISTKNGEMNGQICGAGADAAQKCVVVDAIQPMGLLITNGQFVAFNGPDPIEVVVSSTCKGSVRLVNCAFWGPAIQNVVAHGSGFVSLNDCYMSSGKAKHPGLALIEADAGRIQIRGCTFATGEPSIHLKPGLLHAIVTENNGSRGVSIRNEIGDRAVVANNEPDRKP